MKCFAKIVNGWKPLTAERSILDVWQCSEYAYELKVTQKTKQIILSILTDLGVILARTFEAFFLSYLFSLSGFLIFLRCEWDIGVKLPIGHIQYLSFCYLNNLIGALLTHSIDEDTFNIMPKDNDKGIT